MTMGTETDARAARGKRTPPTTEEVIGKVNKLISLAQSDNEDEARNAALQAVRLMSEHKLSLVPKDDLDRAMKFVEGAREMARVAKEEGLKKLALGAVMGALLAKRL